MKSYTPAFNTKQLIIIFAVISLSLIPYSTGHADDLSAKKIMEKVNDRDDGDNQTSTILMDLLDKKGNKRIRRLRAFSKDKGKDKMQLMFFEHPADVRDTAFLTFNYDDSSKDDNQWLYLPALHKTKRIATSNKNCSFMGSDLNYSDLTSLDLDDYNFSFFEKGKEAIINHEKTWVIWCIPKSKQTAKENGYDKALAFVRQDNFFVVRTLAWIEGSKDKKYFDVKKLEKIDGIFVATKLVITRKKGKQPVHKTILTVDNIKFNQELDDSFFTTRMMEKGL